MKFPNLVVNRLLILTAATTALARPVSPLSVEGFLSAANTFIIGRVISIDEPEQPRSIVDEIRSKRKDTGWCGSEGEAGNCRRQDSSDKSQRDRFIKTARALGSDEDEATFKAKLTWSHGRSQWMTSRLIKKAISPMRSTLLKACVIVLGLSSAFAIAVAPFWFFIGMLGYSGIASSKGDALWLVARPYAGLAIMWLLLWLIARITKPAIISANT
jgi:hypothetical protein